MKDLIRDSALGQFLRFISRRTVLPYPESVPGFTLPESFNLEKRVAARTEAATPTSVGGNEYINSWEVDSEALRTFHPLTASNSNWQSQLDHTISRAASEDREIEPTLTKDGKILVTWYSTNDPENPQNWSSGKKLWVSFLIWYDMKLQTYTDVHR
jgi:DHA1 family multidrug resistance protein-like MFS transporter